MIFQWFDLFGRIFSTFVLSTIYSTIIFIILYIVYRRTKKPILRTIFSKGILYYILLHFLIGLALISNSFSYWEDTGLGEAPQLPIGYKQIIYSPDFARTTFFPDLTKTELNKDELHIDDFIIKNNSLCAKVSHKNSDSPDYDYIVCDLAKRKNKTIISKEDYLKFAVEKDLPSPETFYDFKTHLNEYHTNRPKWKKLLLP